MKTIKYLVVVIVGVVLFSAACKKEYSLETGFGGGDAKGTLLKDAGQCFGAQVNGQYIKDSVLGDSSYINVDVLFSTPGKYKISTETQNGFYFVDSGFVVKEGLQTLRLKAVGKPDSTKLTYFLLMFEQDFCSFSVNVTDSAVVVRNATFNLVDTAGKCAVDTVNGVYKAGTPLNATNTVTVNVNVTRTGDYRITTLTSHGMVFKDQGTFNTTGRKKLILKGAGTPDSAGIKTMTLFAQGNTCAFNLNVLPSGTVPQVDTTWSFIDSNANAYFFGKMDSATVTNSTLPAPPGILLSLTGKTFNPGDTTLNMQIGMLGATTVTPGTYTSTFASNGSVTFRVTKTGSVTPMYAADPSTTNAVMTVVISSYNSTSKLVTGTFNGDARDSTGTPVRIKSGKFRAYVK